MSSPDDAPRDITEVAKDTPAESEALPEIIVTATKRAQLVRDIPSSVAVLTGEQLEKLGVRKVKDLLALVPGVNMQDELGGIQRKVSVRGVGPDTGTNQTVGSVFGDIPISDPYGATTIIDPNPWDLSTVEVLKGPQGTLFGATSLAGLIRYVPNAPKLGVWEGKGFYEYTTVDRGSAAPTYGAALNLPLGSTLALRASGVVQKIPGVIDSDNPARQEKDVDKGRSWNGRVMGLWQPTDKFTVNAWYMKEKRSAEDINLQTFAVADYSRDDAPTASPSSNGYEMGTLDMRYAFDWATLVSLTGYQKKNSFNHIDTSYLVQPLAKLGVSFLDSERHVQTHGLLQELRLVSADDSNFTWLGGIYYSTYSAKIRSELYVPTPDALDQLLSVIPEQLLSLLTGSLVSSSSLNLASNGFDPLKADEMAVYGEANYDFTKRFRLTAGSRLYKTTVDGTLLSSGVAAANNGATPGGSEKGWSPKLATTYKLSPDVLFYGTISRGFQFGGFNLPTIPNPSVPLRFKSSVLWSYEIGARTDWFDRTLRVDVTAFFIDWKNPQVKQADGTGLNSYVDNVGGSHNIGVETTIRWATPLHGLIIEEAASYIEARTSEDFTDASGAEIPSGTLFPSSPKVQSVTTLAYNHEFGNYMTQIALINSLKSSSFTDITHHTKIGGYSLLGFNFNVTRTCLSWSPSLTLSVNNVLNTQKLAGGFGPAAGAIDTSAIIADSSYVYTQPRSVALRLSAEF